jgi:hypothetical protein
MTELTPHDRAILSATDQVMRELLEELAASRPLQGPLSVRFGAPDGVHEVLDANGEIVAEWPVPEFLRRATEIAKARN